MPRGFRRRELSFGGAKGLAWGGIRVQCERDPRHHVGVRHIVIEREKDAACERARAHAMDDVDGGKAALDIGGPVRCAVEAADLEAQASGNMAASRCDAWRERHRGLAIIFGLLRLAPFDRGGLSHVSPFRGPVSCVRVSCVRGAVRSEEGHDVRRDWQGGAWPRPCFHFTWRLEIST